MWRGCRSRPLHAPQKNFIAVQMLSPLLSKLQQKDEIFFIKNTIHPCDLWRRMGRYYIHGFYNVGEEEFIADYFIHYGDEVQTVESMALREVIRTRLRMLTMHYKEMA